jgi:hypothetical protein
VTGAEQLLLDTHALKTFLMGMPSVESLVVTKLPTPYLNAVTKGMNKAEMLLKACMTDTGNADEFVTQYARLLPESDVNELQKVRAARTLGYFH